MILHHHVMAFIYATQITTPGAYDYRYEVTSEDDSQDDEVCMISCIKIVSIKMHYSTGQRE